jgi:hypothetical protein
MVGGLLAVLLAGCGGGGSGLDTRPATRSTAVSPSSPQPTTMQPTPTPTPTASTPWATVNVGTFGKDPAVAALTRYAPTRTEAVITYNPKLPAFVAVVTPAWQANQATKIAKAQAKGWTVPRGTRWSIVGASRTGPAARVRACLWGPTDNFIDARTGQVQGKESKDWEPLDVRMVLEKGVWKVDHAYDATFSCKGAR